ncbi:PolC-type DNA polymerase III [Nitzschia inconspicua]|uniref:PolC-type DNA polymerase III n=1 Tax=Nitzschia inconspicua TaxID=303405 RepID=A0A9K3L2A9_9STRA|nr:PolC-type DNA polymerase III [Nitzschia inconspicua]
MPPKRRKCGACKGDGHDRRNCPALRATQAENLAIPAVDNRNGVDGGPSRLPIGATMPEIIPNINWDKVCYVLFDLETTGGSRTKDDIIELAAMVLGPDGIAIEDGSFESLIRPHRKITPYITTLTGITNEMVKTAPTFPEVMNSFFRFVGGIVRSHCILSSTIVDAIVLVAHNGRAFDIPFLLRSLQGHNLQSLLSDDPRYGYFIDTLHVARTFLGGSAATPTNNRLGTLFQFVTGAEMENSHRAMGDVKALYTVFRSPQFWDRRIESLNAFPPIPAVDVSTESDSDESDSDTDSVEGRERVLVEQDIDESDPKNEDVDEVLGDYWQDGEFIPSEVPEEMFQKFTERFSSPRRPGERRTGLQVSEGMANSPIKAWRLIFTTAILERIVKHTNKYGQKKLSLDWTPIDKAELTDFIAVLFVMSIQKRKDKPSNWFSSNPLLESPVAKKITTGRQFQKMLRYLHCCDPDQNATSDDGEYDPSYKILEFKNSLEKRWAALFVPHQELSLDETLLRAFGRMKFKVRIISKAARYGIKLYVVTDAATAFVMGVLVYTGKYTYSDTRSESTKKTVQVVQQLCEPFRGSHRTVYVDRFYSSVDLLKQLEDMQLYTTGTILSNRIPRSMTIAKSSREFKAMNRGDSVSHVLTYTTTKGERKQAGLVAWKDRNIVYCITNDTPTAPMDECKRRGQGGIVTIKRPQVITKYNRHMGGVDLADMRRLHCHSTIMGQNRWWLKLFFYLLDVGTSNALVLYNEAMNGKQEPYNIVDFKNKVVEALVGPVLVDDIPSDQSVAHCMTNISGAERQRCTYCSLKGKVARTRYMCKGCGVPYCCIGSGKTDKDCFASAHENEGIREICIRHYRMQQTNTRKDLLKKRR